VRLKVAEARPPAGAFHGTVGNMFSDENLIIRLQVTCLVKGNPDGKKVYFIAFQIYFLFNSTLQIYKKKSTIFKKNALTYYHNRTFNTLLHKNCNLEKKYLK